MPEDLTQQFLRTYNVLDEWLRAQCAADQRTSHARLIDIAATDNPLIREAASRLHAYRSLRNALVHISPQGEEERIATPIKQVVSDYANLCDRLRTPPRALEAVAITDNIFRVNWSTRVHTAVAHMLERGFRIAPVIEQNRLVGAFTESSLWQAMATDPNGTLKLTANTTFGDLTTVCGMNPPPLGVVLMHEDATISDIDRLFANRFAQGLFTSAVLFTTNGSADEPLLGLATAHDLPGAGLRA